MDAKLVADVIDDNTIIVEEGLLSTRDLPNLIPYVNKTLVEWRWWNRVYQLHVEFAAFPEKDVIAIIGDGKLQCIQSQCGLLLIKNYQ